MKNEELAKQLVAIFSKYDVSFTSTGMYNLPNWLVEKAIAEILETGTTKIIRQHQQWTWGNWELEEIKEHGLDNWRCPTITNLRKLRKLKEFWGDKTDLDILNDSIRTLVDRKKVRESYKYARKEGFTPKLKEQCRARDGYKCVKCRAIKNLEVDHIKELVDGGKNVLENLQTLCRGCHRVKTNGQIKLRKKCGI